MKWTLVYTKQAQKDAVKISRAGLRDKAQVLLDILAENPYQNPPSYEKLVGDLSGALGHALASLQHCRLCNNFSEAEICPTCANPRRDKKLLAVVEMPADLNTLESTQSYNGLYFVLMGRLSPLDGIGPREISMDKLLNRALDGVVEEVVLATNFTPEGEATAHMLGERLHEKGLRVSRLARGVPLGGELEYVDLGTIAQAFRERRPV